MKYTFLILLAFIAGPAWGQSGWLESTHVGIAVEDVENASGIGFGGYWKDYRFEISETHLALGPLAYNFRNYPENGGYINDHELGLGYRIYRGIYAGTILRWNSEKNLGWNIYTLFRPADWFSFALNANSLASKLPSSLEMGVGLDPFTFDDYLATRLVFF